MQQNKAAAIFCIVLSSVITAAITTALIRIVWP